MGIMCELIQAVSILLQQTLSIWWFDVQLVLGDRHVDQNVASELPKSYKSPTHLGCRGEVGGYFSGAWYIISSSTKIFIICQWHVSIVIILIVFEN